MRFAFPIVASLILIVLITLLASTPSPQTMYPQTIAVSPPRSVILFIGDGMGPQQIGLFLDWNAAHGTGPGTTAIERIALEGETGWVRTLPANALITDSAASATAIATGVSTNNSAVGVSPFGFRLTTCLEDAHASGRRSGLVTTTSITHATPASFAAHVDTRANEPEIARQYVEEANVDVILGGGKMFVAGLFPALAPDLRDSMRERGITWLDKPEQLDQPLPDTRVIGTFATRALPYVIDRDAPDEPKAPTLTQMTKRAIERLSRDGSAFFLMVEGGRIDHAGHLNDAAALLGELREFDDALRVALDHQAANPDTLVLVTADHETGGAALAATGMEKITLEHLATLGKVQNSMEYNPKLADENPIAYKQYVGLQGPAARARSTQWSVQFSSTGHSGTPISLFAIGPGQEQFRGFFLHEKVGQDLRAWMQVAP